MNFKLSFSISRIPSFAIVTEPPCTRGSLKQSNVFRYFLTSLRYRSCGVTFFVPLTRSSSDFLWHKREKKCLSKEKFQTCQSFQTFIFFIFLFLNVNFDIWRSIWFIIIVVVVVVIVFKWWRSWRRRKRRGWRQLSCMQLSCMRFRNRNQVGIFRISLSFGKK